MAAAEELVGVPLLTAVPEESELELTEVKALVLDTVEDDEEGVDVIDMLVELEVETIVVEVLLFEVDTIPIRPVVEDELESDVVGEESVVERLDELDMSDMVPAPLVVVVRLALGTVVDMDESGTVELPITLGACGMALAAVFTAEDTIEKIPETALGSVEGMMDAVLTDGTGCVGIENGRITDGIEADGRVASLASAVTIEEGMDWVGFTVTTFAGIANGTGAFSPTGGVESTTCTLEGAGLLGTDEAVSSRALSACRPSMREWPWVSPRLCLLRCSARAWSLWVGSEAVPPGESSRS